MRKLEVRNVGDKYIVTDVVTDKGLKGYPTRAEAEAAIESHELDDFVYDHRLRY